MFGVPISKVIDRLDALLMVLKTCKAEGCVKPWSLLHPTSKTVTTIKDALHVKYDDFYAEIPRVRFDSCAEGYIIQVEGPIWGIEGKGFIPG